MYYEAAKWLLLAGLAITGIGGAGTWFDRTRSAGRATGSAGLLLVLAGMLCQL